MNSRGFTLVESLLAVALMGLALAGLMPSFMTYTDTNTLSEQRSAAVLAGQQVLEQLRRQDPRTLPSSGSSSPANVVIGARTFQTVNRYCVVPTLCGTESRHVLVEVSHDGQQVYSLETVYTRLR